MFAQVVARLYYDLRAQSINHCSIPLCYSEMSICAAATTLTEEPPRESIGYRVENTAIAFIIIQSFFVGLRFFARHIAGTAWNWDDVLVPVALLFSYALSGVLIGML